jgi:REP element-mobilizing transposase RayT
MEKRRKGSKVGEQVAEFWWTFGLRTDANKSLESHHDHVHLVTAKHRFDGDELIACLKRAGTRGLNEEGLNPMSAYRGQSGRLPSPRGRKGWKVILDTQEHMNSATRYVERNPIRAGFKAQRWSFVVPLVG